MKILLDECITKKLKFLFSNHIVYTVNDMKWNGYKNGKLMTKCVENSFDILLTIDKNLLSQQNVNKYNMTIVVLDAINSKIETLIPFISIFEEKLATFKKGESYIIQNL